MKPSVFQWLGNNSWKILFFITPLFYCFFYAPFGINETDGGVFTSLAWQLENGKILYRDLVYVRPPLTVWLRWLELWFLPENLAVLGERWIFYLKLGLYSWLGSAILKKGNARWILASFGFVVSAHNASAMAWHTTDGVFFSVLGCWLFFNTPFSLTLFLSGICIGLSVLCKQSFYPLLVAFPVVAFLHGAKRNALLSTAGLAFVLGGFCLYLSQNHLLHSFWEMTSGSTTLTEAVKHGLGDYGLAAGALGLVGLGFFALGKLKPESKHALFIFCILGVLLVFPIRVYFHQETTVPWQESRFFFLLACGFLIYRLFIQTKGEPFLQRLKDHLKPLLLLTISWCTAISWGYNLPIFFGVPLVWGVMEWTSVLKPRSSENQTFQLKTVTAFALLLLVFGYAQQFIYRDGKRNEMTKPMGAIFHQLSGIYSDNETFNRYMELKTLASGYPNFKTIPAFLPANYLTRTKPPLAIDWLIDEEINEAKPLIVNSFIQAEPILFLEKVYLPGLYSARHLTLVQALIQDAKKIEETPNFIVLQPNYSGFQNKNKAGVSP